MKQAQFSQDARDKTFGLRTSADLLDKLKWELDQAQRKSGRIEEAYFGANAALTAHHTLDWIACEIVENEKCSFADAELGLGLTGKPSIADVRKALQKFAAAANKWMHVFQQTADAVKHRDLHFYSPTVGSHSIKPDEDEATRLRTFVTFEGREPDGIWGIYGGGIYFVGMDVHVWLSTLIDRLGLRPERAT